jgi:hypothetical protein
MLKLLKSPRIDSKESLPPVYGMYGSLAGRYDNPIPTRFLAPTDCLKIPAQARYAGRIGSLESIPGLLKRSQIRALW